MTSQKEVNSIFNKLSLSNQNSLLPELRLDQELQGKVLSEAIQEVVQERKKKPCPHCKLSFISAASRKMFKCIAATAALSGRLKQQEQICTTYS